MRLAIISDIHGNLIALEAVLADIQRQGVDQIICLGDIANVGPHPSQCLDVVRDLNCPVLQGNHELYLLGDIRRFEGDKNNWHTSPIWSGMRWSREQLRPDQMDYIANLPTQYEIEGDGHGHTRAHALFVHASPFSQFKGFMPFHNDESVARRMEGWDNVTVFAGHTHFPLLRPWSNALIVNGGAVGMPADGTPTAKYLIATQQRYEWQVEFRHIDYNRERLMAEFDKTGLQQAGGKVTAVFRHQMYTGQLLIPQYLQALYQQEKENNLTIHQSYDIVPMPPEVERWCNGKAGVKG